MTSVGNQTLENSQTNHFITVVGWGTYNTIDFWIIKNSYGKDWGEGGYFRLIRGINSRGFNTLVSYPLMANNSLITKHWLAFNLSIFALILLFYNLIQTFE